MAEEKNQPGTNVTEQLIKAARTITMSDSMKHGHNTNEASQILSDVGALKLTPEQSLAVAEKISQQMQSLANTLLQAQSPIIGWVDQQQKLATVVLDRLGRLLQPALDAAQNIQFNVQYLEKLNEISKALSDTEGELITHDFAALIPYLGLEMYENGVNAADFTFDDLFEANIYTIDNTKDLEERLKPIAELILAAREERNKLNETVWAILEELKDEDYPESFRQYVATRLESDPDFKVDLNFIFHLSTDENENLVKGSFFLRLIEKARATIDEKEKAEIEMQPFIDAAITRSGIQDTDKYKGMTLSAIRSTAGEETYLSILEEAYSFKQVSDNLASLENSATPKYFNHATSRLATGALLGESKYDSLIGHGATDLLIWPGKNNELTIVVNVSLENMDGVTITGKTYSEYDSAVTNAVLTLALDRLIKSVPDHSLESVIQHLLKTLATPIQSSFTASSSTIYRTLTGMHDSEFVSPQQRKEIQQSIDKQSKHIRLSADFTPEMMRRKIIVNDAASNDEEKYGLVIDDWLLPAKKIANGKGKDADVIYKFSIPDLLLYSLLTKQLITVSSEMQSIHAVDSSGKITGEILSNSSDRTKIKNYLQRRIGIICHDNKEAQSRKRAADAAAKKKGIENEKDISDYWKVHHDILFDSLFDSCEITDAKKKQRSREYTFACLDYWKAKKMFHHYEKRKKGKSIDAIFICFE